MHYFLPQWSLRFVIKYISSEITLGYVLAVQMLPAFKLMMEFAHVGVVGFIFS